MILLQAHLAHADRLDDVCLHWRHLVRDASFNRDCNKMRLCRAIKNAEQLECIDILLNTMSAGEREIGGSGVLLINVTCR